MSHGVWWALIVPVAIVIGLVVRYIWVFRQMERESFPRDKRTPPLRPDTGIPPIGDDKSQPDDSMSKFKIAMCIAGLVLIVWLFSWLPLTNTGI